MAKAAESDIWVNRGVIESKSAAANTQGFSDFFGDCNIYDDLQLNVRS